MTHSQLCQLGQDWRGDVPAGGLMAEEKRDGWRCLYFRGRDGQPGLWTRQGMPIEGAAHILYRLRLMEAVAGHGAGTPNPPYHAKPEKEDSMATKPLPEQSLLLKLLRYEPETGKLFWLERPLSLFGTGGIGAALTHKNWNRRYAGQEAFPCASPKGARGYVQAQIFKQKFLKHRLIWKMVTGEEPQQIDHINGNKADNRFCNLRDVTCAENLRNVRLHDRNKSGCTGVFWNKQFGRWQAYITVAGHTKHLGLHPTKDSAIRARKSAERKLGFHPNHGRSNIPPLPRQSAGSE